MNVDARYTLIEHLYRSAFCGAVRAWRRYMFTRLEVDYRTAARHAHRARVYGTNSRPARVYEAVAGYRRVVSVS